MPLSALFAFARIDMANAYYGDLKVGSDQAALTAVAGGGQVVTAAVPAPQGATDWLSVSLSLTGSKT
ncbi:MAG: hypothetical protein E6I51_05240, partial [Chloroflexi bacterium]